MPSSSQHELEAATIVSAVREGNESAFTAVTARQRRELHVHCYRMLGSFADAEDMVQETFLRAWRRRETFEGRSSLRAWLYAIATNGCIDFLEARQQRTLTGARTPEPAHVPWLEPYPDRLLDPDTAVVTKENIELAFLVAMQHLPPKQRAVLILCDVLDWSAKEAAALLELTPASVNSALQRARATMNEHPRSRPARPDDADHALIEQLVAATERGDLKGLAALLRDDVRWSMPPYDGVVAGRDPVVQAWLEGGFGTPDFGELRCLLTSANRMPALAGYVRKPGTTRFVPLAMDVIRIEDGAVAEITTFELAPRCEAFGLPSEL